MENLKNNPELSDILFLFPVYVTNFVNYILNSIEEGFPKGLGVLLILSKYGPMPISYIGERLAVRKPNMTPIIDEIEGNGWVKRCASPTDRRIINIQLTEEGEKVLEKYLQQVNEVLEKKLDVLTEEEINKSREAVMYLIGTMDKVTKSKL